MSPDPRRHAPATLRNRDAILDVLRQVLPADGLVLEVASGTGEHVVHFARALPALTWQPSDPDPAARESIAAWVASEDTDNVLPPLDLEVGSPWPLDHADAVICINMVHIAPWPATLALVAGAARLLPRTGVLVLYGPYRREGQHTAPSNEAFDQQLRSSNPDWGVRDLEAVTKAAASHGLVLQDVIAMPANNFCVVFRPSVGVPCGSEQPDHARCG